MENMRLTGDDLAGLENYLKKDNYFDLKDYIRVPASYQITMNNDYLSPFGDIVKKQQLQGNFTRSLNNEITQLAAGYKYVWDKMLFSSKDKKADNPPLEWSFIKGLNFFYRKSFGESGGLRNDCLKYKEFGNWYDSLISSASVNLMYMVTWDIIMFEEICSDILFYSKKIKRIGDSYNLGAVSNSMAALNFKGCSKDDSYFDNGELVARFDGFSLYEGQMCALYSFQCIGKLNVSTDNKDNFAEQTGQSYFLGNIFIDSKSGDLVAGDLIELITASIKNNEGKILPIQKRRVVRIEKK